MIKAVYDANIYVSGLLYKGNPYKVFEAARTPLVKVFVSDSIVSEIYNALRSEYFNLSHFEAKRLIHRVLKRTELITPTQTVKVVKDDPDDNKYLECALTARAKCIVTGDQHLLDIKKFKSIKILSARSFLEEIGIEPLG